MPNIASFSRLVSTAPSWDFPDVDDTTISTAQDRLASGVPSRWKMGAAAIVGIICLAVVVVSGGIVWRATTTPKTEILDASGPQMQAPVGAETSGEASLRGVSPVTVVIHISGAVVRPGLVELPAGSRVHDALEAAGGPEPEADTGAINLARILLDGEQVVVPVWGEVFPQTPSAKGGPISLTSADVSALDSLPGIGPSLAQRIIDWREAHGPFVSVEDVLAVPGIGESTLARFRDLVTP